MFGLSAIIFAFGAMYYGFKGLFYAHDISIHAREAWFWTLACFMAMAATWIMRPEEGSRVNTWLILSILYGVAGVAAFFKTRCAKCQPQKGDD